MSKVGDVVGGYRLEEEVGSGAMGRVFRGTHTLLGRRAAVKILNLDLSTDAEYVSRFFLEAKIVNAVKHPNIIDIIEFVHVQDPPLVAYLMELLEGLPLSKLVQFGAMSEPETVSAGLQLVSALRAVHRVNVVHRDLKPENIFALGVGDDGVLPPNTVFKILDFGIAKADGMDAAHKTRTGFIIGTPSYMAPEQVFGEPVSAATDIYALGEILFEMVSGTRLFRGPISEIMRQKLDRQTGPRLPEIAASPRLTELIQRCIAVVPADRPRLEEIGEELQAIASGELVRPASLSASPPSRGGVPTRIEAPSRTPLARAASAAMPLVPAASAAMPVDGFAATAIPLARIATADMLAATVPRGTSAASLRAKAPEPVDSAIISQISPYSEALDAEALEGVSRRGPKIAAVALGALAIVGLAVFGGKLTQVGASKASAPSAKAMVPPAPAPPETVSVAVDSSPTSAEVFESGRSLGLTPLVVPVTRGAPRQVELRLDGHAPATIQLDAGHSRVVVPLPRAEPPVAVSPRHEPGPARATRKGAKVVDTTIPGKPKSGDALGLGMNEPAPDSKPLRRDEVTPW